MIVADYEAKMKDLEEDFLSSLARLNIAVNTMETGLFLPAETDNEEILKVKEKIKNETMTDFGRIIEFGLKYFIKLKRMELFPNEIYDDPTNSQNRGTFKAKMNLNKGTINEFLSKACCNDETIKEEFNRALNQSGKGHSFYLSYLLIDKLDTLFFDVKELIGRIILLDKISKGYEKKNKIDKNTIGFIAFPASFYASEEWGAGSAEIKALVNIYEQLKTDTEKNGDVFTQLRYYSNNQGANPYDFDTLAKLSEQLLIVNDVVKTFGNNLNINPDIQYAYYTLIRNAEYTQYSKKEIDQLFSNKKLISNPKLMYYLFVNHKDFHINNIFEILSSKEIDEKELEEMFYHAITLKEKKYFNAKGIYDYSRMDYELLPGKNGEEKLFNGVLKNYYTIEEYDAKINGTSSTNENKSIKK